MHNACGRVNNAGIIDLTVTPAPLSTITYIDDNLCRKISSDQNYQQSLSLSEVEDCGRQLERICLNISSNYASYFKRVSNASVSAFS